MGDENQTNGSADDNRNLAAQNASKLSSKRSYRLVVIMLSLLTGLVVMAVLMPLVFIICSKDSQTLTAVSKDLTDYAKWTIAVLLGAFGAWIGAGAAYFFGKENLAESSRSTEEAMKIQQGLFQRQPVFGRIKDMTLTAMNRNFIFDVGAKSEDITNKLKDTFRGYWFVPVVEKDTGILKDIIHAQAFWNPELKGKSLEEMVAEMDKNENLKKLHGESFFTRVSPNDKISDVYDLMDKKDAEVAIVVDEKGKPSYCLTKTELRTFLNVTV